MIHWVAWFGCNELTIFDSNKLLRFESKMNSKQHVSPSVLLLGYQFSLGEAGLFSKTLRILLQICSHYQCQGRYFFLLWTAE